MHLKRFSEVLAAISALSAVGAGAAPNVVFLLSDDLGYGEVSIMPQRPDDTIQTPNIDKLFRSGMRFKSAYANPVCAPTRASLMVGKHLGHSPIRGNLLASGAQPLLRAEDTTFLQTLQSSADYKVSCIGKWHLGTADDEGAPWLKGCDEFWGAITELHAMIHYPNKEYNTYTAETGLLTSSYPQNINATRKKCMAPNTTCKWAQDMFVEATLDSLDAHAARQANEKAQGDAVRPFFLYWAVTTPHAAKWSRETAVGQPVPSQGQYASESWPEVEKDHVATIANYHDKAVGDIVSRLESLGLRENTVVFYASDNGAGSNGGGHDPLFFRSSGPLTGWKRWLSEGGMRIPFAVSWPGVIPAGAVSSAPIAIWDVAPTVLSMAGVPETEWPKDMDGVSLFENLLKPGMRAANYTHPPLFWEYCTSIRFSSVTRTGTGWGRAVRANNWKAIWHFDAGAYSQAQLYNISSDIAEAFDVADANPDVVSWLSSVADKAHVDDPNFPRTDRCLLS